MFEKSLNRARSFLWAGLLLLLPVTSMPLVRSIIGSSTVAAPSILLLVVMLAVWLLPFLLRGGRLSRLSLPVFAFALVALLSCAAAFFLPIPSFKDLTIARQEAEGLITLAIGLSFYLVTATWLTTPARLQTTLRWINLGGFLLITWSLAQAVAWFVFGGYPAWMRDFQDIVSLGPLYRQRVTGFAVEPSWLAHQLNMLYLPLWLSASVQRVSAHPRRFAGITVENSLLICGVIVLGLSFSRVGLAAFFGCLAYLFLLFNRWLAGRLRAGLSARFRPAWQRSVPPLVALGLLLAYAALCVGGLFTLSRLDPRMAGIFTPSFWRNSDFFIIANRLQFGERVAYWNAGWVIFNLYPWLGVGLGNAGFFFRQALPAYAWNFVEVRRIMAYQSALPNVKSLWLRLLAETGAVGFAIFLAWLVVLWIAGAALRRSCQPLVRLVGMAALFVLIGFALEGFSIDSFALPYNWVSFGLLTAALHLETRAGVINEWR